MLTTDEPLRPSRASRLGRWLAHFAFVLFATALIAHRFLGLDTPAFIVIGALVPFIAVAAIALGMLGLRRFWNDDVPGAGIGIWAIVLGLGLLAPYGWVVWQAYATPMLVDVSTDPLDPPQMNVAAAARSGIYMNRIMAITSSERREMLLAYPGVHSRRYARAAIDVEAKVAELVLNMGWALYPEAPQPADWPERTFEAHATTTIMGFPADVAIRVIDEGDGAFVDMRSASVYGRHDLGDNAARIIGFLDELDRRVNEIVLTPAVESSEAE